MDIVQVGKQFHPHGFRCDVKPLLFNTIVLYSGLDVKKQHDYQYRRQGRKHEKGKHPPRDTAFKHRLLQAETCE